MTKRHEDSFRRTDSLTGYATVDAATAITWTGSGLTYTDYIDVIAGTVYIEETGSSNGLTYSVLVNGVEVTDGGGTVAAGAKGAIEISGRIGDQLSVKLNSTSPGNSATATITFFGK